MSINLPKFRLSNGTKIKLCLFGDASIYVKEMVESLRAYCDIILFTFSNNGDLPFQSSRTYEYHNLLSWGYYLDILPAYFKIKKYSKNIDVVGVHYLSAKWEILLALGVIRKPVVYFVYGSDVNRIYGALHTRLKTHVLQRFQMIFAATESQKNMLISRYNIRPDKITTDVLWWSINPCFRRYDDDTIYTLREKWGLKKRCIIFSPRGCHEKYQHHLLIEAVSRLDIVLKSEIIVVITQMNQSTEMIQYIEKLKKLAHKLGVNLVAINRCLNPMEMAEIYNIALINVNIPDKDQLGRSILEGSLCGSIPLLNEEIPVYHDVMVNAENCIFVSPNPDAISKAVITIISDADGNNEVIRKNNIAKFMSYTNVNENSHKLYGVIQTCSQK